MTDRDELIRRWFHPTDEERYEDLLREYEALNEFTDKHPYPSGMESSGRSVGTSNDCARSWVSTTRPPPRPPPWTFTE